MQCDYVVGSLLRQNIWCGNQSWSRAVRSSTALFSGDLPLTGQALPGEPLHGANGPDDIRAIRAAVDLPIIGLYKDNIPGYPVYITPTMEHVRAIAAAGADIIAIDATQRLLPHGTSHSSTPYSAGSQHCHSVASAAISKPVRV